MKRLFKGIVYRCKMFKAHILNEKWWFVSCDVEADEASGQGEIDTCVVLAKNENEARAKSVELIAHKWEVPLECVYVFDIVQTTNRQSLMDE